MQLAFVPVVKTLELSGASKRESASGDKNKCVHASWCLVCIVGCLGWERERLEGSQPRGNTDIYRMTSLS